MKIKQFGTFFSEPLTVNIGAEISKIDLNKLERSDFQSIHDALIYYQVIFFRNQDLTSESHEKIAKYFGEPVVHPAYPRIENTSINILESTPENPTKIELWHTDMTFHKSPPLGSFLRAWEVPDVGGDTMWGSSCAAYEALPDELRNKLDKLHAVHDFKHGFQESIAEKGIEHFSETIKKYPPVEHPVIRTHPVSGRKGLFVNPLFTSHIRGMDEKDSTSLLTFLYKHMTKDEFTVRFRWRKNSIAIWDNRSTIHKPVNDYFPAYRQLRRITIKGDVPR